MKITYKNAVKQTKKFQQGGPVGAPAEDAEAPVSQEEAPEEPAPEEGGQEDPMMQLAQLAQLFAQGLQNQDCQMLAQGAQMFLQLVEQSQGGGAEEPQGEPVFRKGGRLAYRIKK
jgi:hypothetical protein